MGVAWGGGRKPEINLVGRKWAREVGTELSRVRGTRKGDKGLSGSGEPEASAPSLRGVTCTPGRTLSPWLGCGVIGRSPGPGSSQMTVLVSQTHKGEAQAAEEGRGAPTQRAYSTREGFGGIRGLPGPEKMHSLVKRAGGDSEAERQHAPRL